MRTLPETQHDVTFLVADVGKELQKLLRLVPHDLPTLDGLFVKEFVQLDRRHVEVGLERKERLPQRQEGRHRARPARVREGRLPAKANSP